MLFFFTFEDGLYLTFTKYLIFNLKMALSGPWRVTNISEVNIHHFSDVIGMRMINYLETSLSSYQ